MNQWMAFWRLAWQKAIPLFSALSVVIWLFSFASIASAAVPIKQDMPVVDLTSEMLLFKDAGNDQTIRHILLSNADSPLKPWTESSANFGFDSASYWVAVALENKSNFAVSTLIRQDYPLIDYLDFWYVDHNNVINHVSTGDRTDFDTRPLTVRDFVFPVQIAPQSSVTLYFRYSSDGPINIGLKAMSQQAYIESIANEQLWFGAYYGGFIVLFIYNLILFLAVRERAYIFYMAYVASYGIYMSVHNGFAFQFLWPQFPEIGNMALLVLLGLSLLFGIKFSRVVCNIRHFSPITDKVSSVVQTICVILLCLVPFFEYKQLIIVFSLHTIVVCLNILWIGSLCVYKGYMPARYFLVAWLALLVFVIIYMLKTFGLLPHNGFTQNSFQIGSLVEMVLLSVALGARVRDIKRLSQVDYLTGLSNKQQFEKVLGRDFAYAKHSDSPLTLLVMDIDHFKQVNDTHGHSIGDLVLEGIGEILSKNVRKPAFVGRYGGEEFVVLLPRTDSHDGYKLAQRIRTLVSKMKINDLRVTASIGQACFMNNNFSSAEQLFEAADAALYRAKEGGRDRVEAHQSIQATTTVSSGV